MQRAYSVRETTRSLTFVDGTRAPPQPQAREGTGDARFCRPPRYFPSLLRPSLTLSRLPLMGITSGFVTLLLALITHLRVPTWGLWTELCPVTLGSQGCPGAAGWVGSWGWEERRKGQFGGIFSCLIGKSSYGEWHILRNVISLTHF